MLVIKFKVIRQNMWRNDQRFHGLILASSVNWQRQKSSLQNNTIMSHSWTDNTLCGEDWKILWQDATYPCDYQNNTHGSCNYCQETYCSRIFYQPRNCHKQNNFCPDRIYKMCETRATTVQPPVWNSGTTTQSLGHSLCEKEVKQIDSTTSAE